MDTHLQFLDPRDGGIALRVAPVPAGLDPTNPLRVNYFTVVWLHQGHGHFWADHGQHPFAAPCLLCFVPYQRFLVEPGPVSGLAVQFHANFLCIETHHAEVGCNGVLFNDPYGSPCVPLGAPHEAELRPLVDGMRAELEAAGPAHAEASLSYLKLFLVKAARLKLERQATPPTPSAALSPAMADLRRLVEEHYRAQHSPAFYARRLHLAPKSLAKLVKRHFGKTLTQLIRECVIRQSKWELLHTLKPVKQIAAEVGIEDELYFSRLFKRSAGCAPTFFREYETKVRGGQNVWLR